MAFVKKGIDCHTANAHNNNNTNYGSREHDKRSEQKSKFGFKTATDFGGISAQQFQFDRQPFKRANQSCDGLTMWNINSTYRNDFSLSALVLEHPINYNFDRERFSQHSIDSRRVYANQPGHQKFLDIYARLDYPLHTNEQLIGNRRQDWFQVPNAKGTIAHDDVPSLRCADAQQKSNLRPYAEAQFVPNRGLWSEHQEHYRCQ